MTANTSWIYQGRQEHGWFGTGTGPGAPVSGQAGAEHSPAGLFDPRNAGARIDYAARTVIARLDRKDRSHGAAVFNSTALGRLRNAVIASHGASGLSRDAFRQHFFGAYASDQTVDQWRSTAKALVEARTDQALGVAGEALTQTIKDVGFYRWSRRLGSRACILVAPTGWAPSRLRPSCLRLWSIRRRLIRVERASPPQEMLQEIRSSLITKLRTRPWISLCLPIRMIFFCRDIRKSPTPKKLK
jgi:hypothetical protein